MSSPSISPRVPDNSDIITSLRRVTSLAGRNSVNVVSSRPITQIVTSKTWVLPPRPKPGRKPSSDIPSTKRKAQNRAAQRAFRERRANRVGELEQQLMELERDNSVKEGVLCNTVKTLQSENCGLKKQVEEMKNTISRLTDEVKSLTQEKSKAVHSDPVSPAEYHVSAKRRKGSGVRSMNNSSLSVSSDSEPLTPPRTETLSKSHNSTEIAEAASVMINFKNSGSVPSSLSVKTDKCGLCSRDECMCKDAGLRESRNSSGSLSDILNGFKPMAAVPLKSGTSSEIDFTTKSKSNLMRKMPTLSNVVSAVKASSMSSSSTSSSSFLDHAAANSSDGVNYEESVISPDEKCGFCSEDTPCLCREIAEQKKLRDDSKSKSSLEALSSSILSPERLQQIKKQIAMCTGSPGSCPQCQKDPMSTLFCTTIAATSGVRFQEAPVLRKSNGKNKAGTILPAPRALIEQKKNADRSQIPSLVELELSNPGKHYVPCADAYRTLSRHANFRRAGLSSVINNLNTNGMFVEVESIVKCLRQLDSQFGSN
ncbi:hypothetical protein FOA43_000273 [Brettanomyces nanus]|uniref:BZIP domain-containing protein n=1 Tax=Eeniella nana TaxID=13502 RepID=A0A875RZ76_EENNA|nr:uncharacterized protein FOA43_000273 [Brettanomyces nanus]QPG72969.1 hypothetical protein FOA43_000273 [Brettanomyces nanus]